jgi:hypothetical protein
MLDGRQVAVLARCWAGDYDAALHLLDNSPIPKPWEQAVTAFLRALCAARRPPQPSLAAMIDSFHALGPTPGHPVVRIRLNSVS